MTSTNININENFQRADLPSSIIWPPSEEDVAWFMQRLYDQMASAINSKDFNYFPMAIGSTATPILNMNAFGAYLLCVGGTDKVINPTTGVVNWLPSYVFALAKAKDTVAGVIPAALAADPGVGDIWGGATLSVTTVTLNGQQVYALNHSIAGQTGSFNVRIVGTQ